MLIVVRSLPVGPEKTSLVHSHKKGLHENDGKAQAK